MNGLSSGQATTSYFEKTPEKVDRPARAVIFETARAAPTKDHAETQGWVELKKATKDTRPSPCGGPEYWASLTPSEQELPRLESGRRGYR